MRSRYDCSLFDARGAAVQSRMGSTLAPSTRREQPAFDQDTLLRVLSHRCLSSMRVGMPAISLNRLVIDLTIAQPLGSIDVEVAVHVHMRCHEASQARDWKCPDGVFDGASHGCQGGPFGV